jgi:L-ascorbate metabolism protein UlaG (beta-lactamase superfamily)
MRSLAAALALAVLAAPAGAALAAPGSSPLVNDTGKTIIRRLAPGNDMSTVIVSSKGTTLFLDPRSTKLVPDAVAVTHGHHLDKAYLEVAKAAKSLVMTPGTIVVKDVKVTGIPASHGPYPVKSPPDFVIMLVEVDGLRIAFVACSAQKVFSPEQRAALGKVDVVMVTAENESGGRTAKNAYALAKSLSPRIILPLTHHVTDYELALDDISDAGGKVETQNDPLVLDAASLQGKPERVINLLATAAP